ncbi:MAG: PVC-type heme-binding CxxCH protein [Pirellulales bacterium]
MSRYRSLFALALVVGAPALLSAAEDPLLVAPTEAISPEEQQKKFRLPPGFEIQLVAAEPEVQKPMNLAFDPAGRLWVTQSVEYPWPAKGDAKPRDTLRIYDQFGPDGRAGRVQVFADGLNIPIGVLPIAGGAIAHSIPTINRVTDSDGDGKADRREVLFGDIGFRDTHGMASSFTPWIDGWVYACHGYANDSTVRGADDKAIKMNSGNTYRFRADGSTIEYFTHGQVNPFGMCFDPLGNVYTSDCHTLPVYQLLRGAWYPSFGKPHDGLGFGPTMISHLHGSTGIAGVVWYEADQFPAEWRGSVFIGNPVTGRINHDKVKFYGSTSEAIEQPDFVSCDDPWFRPVDIKLGPDGALYVADFYNCIIGHYEVPLTHPRRDRSRGRIWRIVYTGEGRAAQSPGDLGQSSAAEIVKLLDHENLWVRVTATNQLVERIGAPAGPMSAAVLASSASARQQVHAMWVVERLGGLSDQQLARLLNASDRLLRVHVIKLLAERPDWKASRLGIAERLRERLEDDDPYVRRAAADALGRHPEAKSVAPLLVLWNNTRPDDTHLVHVVRMALRDHVAAPGLIAALGPWAQQPEVARRLAEVSLGAATPEAAAYVLAALESKLIAVDECEPYVAHVARQGSAADQAKLYEYVLATAHGGAPEGLQVALIQSLQRAALARGQTLPPTVVTWADRLAEAMLAGAEEHRQRSGIELARDLKLRGVHDTLLKVAGESPYTGLRPTAIDACLAVDGLGSVEVLAAVAGRGGEPLDLRQKAAMGLAAIDAPAARGKLLELLPTAPDRLAVVIAAGLAGNAQGADQLLTAIAAGKASAALFSEAIVRERLKVSGLPDAEARVEQLTAGLPPLNERLTALIAARRQGYEGAAPSAERGQKVFETRCALCHRLAQRGAKIGPELDGIGIRGLDRLLEDVLDPNRNVDQAFRALTLVTDDGRVLTGLKLREEGQTVVLADSEGKEVLVPSDQIESQQTANLSAMPANVADLVAEPDFYDLLAYLLAQRPK